MRVEDEKRTSMNLSLLVSSQTAKQMKKGPSLVVWMRKTKETRNSHLGFKGMTTNSQKCQLVVEEEVVACAHPQNVVTEVEVGVTFVVSGVEVGAEAEVDLHILLPRLLQATLWRVRAQMMGNQMHIIQLMRQ